MSPVNGRSGKRRKTPSPVQLNKPGDTTPQETANWTTENAEFVAAYNEIIDADGVALEQYRVF